MIVGTKQRQHTSLLFTPWGMFQGIFVSVTMNLLHQACTYVRRSSEMSYVGHYQILDLEFIW